MNTTEFIKYLQEKIAIADHFIPPDGSHIIEFQLSDGAWVSIEIK